METPESILRFILQGRRLGTNEEGWHWALPVFEGWVLIDRQMTEQFHTYRDPEDWLTFTGK